MPTYTSEEIFQTAISNINAKDYDTFRKTVNREYIDKKGHHEGRPTGDITLKDGGPKPIIDYTWVPETSRYFIEEDYLNQLIDYLAKKPQENQKFIDILIKERAVDLNFEQLSKLRGKNYEKEIKPLLKDIIELRSKAKELNNSVALDAADAMLKELKDYVISTEADENKLKVNIGVHLGTAKKTLLDENPGTLEKLGIKKLLLKLADKIEGKSSYIAQKIKNSVKTDSEKIADKLDSSISKFKKEVKDLRDSNEPETKPDSGLQNRLG